MYGIKINNKQKPIIRANGLRVVNWKADTRSNINLRTAPGSESECKHTLLNSSKTTISRLLPHLIIL